MISRSACEKTALLDSENGDVEKGFAFNQNMGSTSGARADSRSVLNLYKQNIIQTVKIWKEQGYEVDFHDSERDGPLPCNTTFKELLQTSPLLDYDFFWKILLIICTFYTSPSLQFIFFQASVSEQICYYNFKCKIDMFGIPAFNNVISNIGYVLGGLVFISIVHSRRSQEGGNGNNKGLNEHPAFYYSLGIALTFEGVFSALYHVCPSVMNFQFDVTFMVFGGCLMFATLYTSVMLDGLFPQLNFTGLWRL